MSYVSNPVPKMPKRAWTRFLFPAIVLLVCGGLFAAPMIYNANFEFSDELIPLFTLSYLAPPLCVILLTLWWLFFSPFRWRTRFICFAMAAIVVPLLCYLTIRDFEFTTNRFGFVPIFHFAWNPSSSQRFEEFERQRAGDKPAEIDAAVGPEDWPAFRGPKRDGVVTHLKLAKDWDKDPPKVLWKRPCFGGYSGVAVAGNVVVTLEQRHGEEAIVCYDRASGVQRWAYAYSAHHPDKMGEGPRATPTIHDGLIFTFGATGELYCVNTKGQYQWSDSLLKSPENKVTWGMSGSPLIVDDLVVIHAGADSKVNGNSLIAYEQKGGKVRWSVGQRKAGYSSPQLSTLGGVAQILLFDAHGLISYDPKTGKELWATAWETKMDMNSIQPIVIGGDRVFISSEASNGCALFRVTPPKEGATWNVDKLWSNRNLGARFASPVTNGKRLFGLHNVAGVLKCLDLADGSVVWNGDRYEPGQLLLVDDVVLLMSGKGNLLLFDADAAEPTPLAQFDVFDAKTWNMPALAGDQLFLRNQSEIACIQLPRRK